MNRPTAVILCLLFLFLFISVRQLSPEKKRDVVMPTGKEEKPKATGLMLLKGDEDSIADAVVAIQTWTDSFNERYKYPITVFHEDDLTEDHMKKLQSASVSKIDFVLIEFSLPEGFNVSKMKADLSDFDEKFLYLGYRHMCRFFSGNVFTHPAMVKYDYYWRIDDDSIYPCTVDYDVFRFMKKNDIKYGWAIWFFEFPSISGDTLWSATREYVRQQQLTNTRLNEITTVVGGYDRCHYWNNFEIADLNFLRSERYQNYFRYLEKLEGFYLYRWGDALVRTIAVHLLLEEDEVHQFEDISYKHQDFCTPFTCENEYECYPCSRGVCDHCGPLQAKFRGVETWHGVVIIVAVVAAVSYFTRQYWAHWLQFKYDKER